MRRPELWFDEKHSLIDAMRALFPTEQTATQLYTTADPKKVAYWRCASTPLDVAAEQMNRIYGGVIRLVRRAA